MDHRPSLPAPSVPHPVYHVRRPDPTEDPQGDLGYFILRELLALPPAVLNAPVFRKVQGHLENYRKHYT